MRRTKEIAFALMWLAQDVEREPFDAFWSSIITPETTTRIAQVNFHLHCIYEALGLKRRDYRQEKRGRV